MGHAGPISTSNLGSFMMLKVYLRNDAISQMNNSGIFGSPGTSNFEPHLLGITSHHCDVTLQVPSNPCSRPHWSASPADRTAQFDVVNRDKPIDS